MKTLFLQLENKVEYMGEYSAIISKNHSLVFYWKLVTNYEKKLFPWFSQENKRRIFTSELKVTYDFFHIYISLLWIIIPKLPIYDFDAFLTS